MKLTRSLPTQPHRDAWLAINLQALENNIHTIKANLPSHLKLMAIIKADGYGHGAIMCLPTLLGAGITHLGVASIDEALQIRESGFGDIPILVVGPTPSWAYQAAISNNIQLTVFDIEHVKQLAAIGQQLKLIPSIHIKVDTGMHRIGIHWEQAADTINSIMQSDHIDVAGVFSHLACSDDEQFTQIQHQRFNSILAQLNQKPAECHLMNSSGALSHPKLITEEQTIVRLGLAMWGYGSGKSELTPVMSLKGRIVHLQWVTNNSNQPEGISYNHTATVPAGEKRLIATIPIGYADGLPRQLSNQCYGVHWHNGVAQKLPQVGNITMDQLMLDVTDATNIKLGDTITFIDSKPPAASLTDWATQLNTIEYELMCSLRVRLPRTYIRQ